MAVFRCELCDKHFNRPDHLKTHKKSKSHIKMHNLQKLLDKSNSRYNDLQEDYEDLKKTCDIDECPEDELINVNIFTYTDGIEYLRGVDTGFIYELNGDQNVVGRWDEETETAIFDEDEEIILKPQSTP